MDKETVEGKKREIVERFGAWTGNIPLGGDIYTIGKQAVRYDARLRQIVQMVSDITDRPFEQLRILDLACLEGFYSLELARQGAQTVGIEGRQGSYEKASFAKDVMSLKNLQFYCDDVRNLSREKYGSFDVVLCLGILYHLDAPDVFKFIEDISSVCKKAVIIDTHVSLSTQKSFVYKGRRYWGKMYKEHKPKSTIEDRKKALWASLDNVNSFWLTYPSLCNLLVDAGFSSAYECKIPAPSASNPRNRKLLFALKNECKPLLLEPDTPISSRWTEKRTSLRTRIIDSMRLMLSRY